MTKNCGGCGRALPVSEFSRNKRAGDGLQTRCKSCVKVYQEENQERIRLKKMERLRKLRSMALAGYGGACACCGETEEAFLVFDHVVNDGVEHRREVHSARIAEWVIKNGFPDRVQVLCANCNMAKQFNPGGCPHNPDASGMFSEHFWAVRRTRTGT